MARNIDNKEASARIRVQDSTVSSGDCGAEDQKPATATTQDQVLLKALQDYVIPLICGAVKRNNDMDQIPLPAKKLITALKEFISSMVHSQPEEKKVEACLSDEEVADCTRDIPDLRTRRILYAVHKTQFEESSSEDNAEDEDAISDNPAAVENIQLTFEEKLLRALREHVFNKMPIRLLHFELHGSSLQITLVERGAVYAHFELIMQTKLHTAEFRPNLNMSDNKVIHLLISKHVQYAILSHTWLQTASEVTYSAWKKGPLDATAPGYQKLVHFCKVAWTDHGLAFGWMDTVCINKDSSSELDESIRSMYSWYQRADVCIIYLAQTGALQTMHKDPWFTRGWTLQELLAPQTIKFYNTDWKPLAGFADVTRYNDKWNVQITTQIKYATTISLIELVHIHRAPISRRMQLAAGRKVTREEDTAYSLMGIFNVNIATAYGEGAERAFYRLLQEILSTTAGGIMDIFNWAGSHGSNPLPQYSRILPASPRNYIYRSTIKSAALEQPPIKPLTLTHLGLRVPVILMPAISTKDPAFGYDPIGGYGATVRISAVAPEDSYCSATHYLLDKRISGSDGRKDDLSQITFAVLNFTGGWPGPTACLILVRRTCLAIALKCRENAGKVSTAGNIHVIRTEAPIVFDLIHKKYVHDHPSLRGYEFETNELPDHGMQLVTLYL